MLFIYTHICNISVTTEPINFCEFRHLRDRDARRNRRSYYEVSTWPDAGLV